MKKLLLFFVFTAFAIHSYCQVPTISSFSPLSGPTGSVITIKGSNFSSTPANNIVFIGAARATVNSASATQITVTVPPGATCKPITVTTSTLTVYSQNSFIVTFGGGGQFVPTAFDKQIDYSITGNAGLAQVKDIDGDGKPDIVLAIASNTVNSMSVFRNIGTAPGTLSSTSFAPKIDLSMPVNPGAFNLEDVDGDGKPDIVVSSNYSNTVYVLKNTSTPGNVSFLPAVQFSSGNRIAGITVADINGDGKPDIITTNSSDNTFSVLINTSTTSVISFASKTDFTTGSTPGGIIASDFNGDGKPDLAIINSASTSTGNSNISVYMNTTTGGVTSFAPKVDYLTNGATGITAGDLDGDGKPDLAFSNGSSFSVLRNISSSANIIFEPRLDFAGANSLGYSLVPIGLSDFDGDGRLDIIAGASISKNKSTTGNITFDAAASYTFPAGTDFGDLDGDGKPDIISPSQGNNLISIIRNKINEPAINLVSPETGLTGAPITLTGVNFTGTTAVSFGGVPAASYTVNSSTSITGIVGAGTTGVVTLKTPYGTGTGTGFVYGTPPPAITSFAPLSGPIGSTVTISGKNFNSVAANNIVYFGVARATVVSATATQLTVTVPVGANYQPITVTANNLTAYANKSFSVTFANTGPIAANSFSTQVDLPVSPNVMNVSVADLDGDGKTDVIALNSNIFSVFKNTSSPGHTSFAAKQDFTSANYINHIYISDMDGDGKPDLVYFSPANFTILKNTSSAGGISFASPIIIADSAGPTGISIADFDNDGKPDIIVTNGNNNTFSIYRNTTVGGTITFAPVVNFTTNTYYFLGGAYAADLNGDGKMDLVTTNQYQTNQFTNVYKNTSTIGNISFVWVTSFQSGYHPENVIIADFDGDGKPDMAEPAGYNQFYIYKNTTVNGSISFNDAVVYSLGTYPTTIGIGDIDGDGLPDLAVPDSFFPGYVSVFKNTSTPGNAAFATKVDISKGPNPYQNSGEAISTGLVVTDIDGDGRPDMVISNYFTGVISIFVNTIDAPVIATFKPALANSGATVTITGTNFTGATAVSFGGTPAASFTVNSATSITATVGQGASGNVSVTTPIATGTAAGFTFLPAATIASFTPVAAAPGKTVTITGTNFTGATAVSFGGINAKSFTVVSATTITAVVDNVAASGNISVTVPGGIVNHAGFVYAPAPLITSYIPVSGPVGTTVTITGNNFNVNAAANIVYFGAAQAVVQTATTTQLTVTVPPGATYQPITVLNTAVALSTSSTNGFVTTFNTKHSIASTDFDPKVDVTTPNGVQSANLSDIDGDGKLDVLTVNPSANSFSVYRNTAATGSVSASSFAAKVDFSTGNGPQAMAIGDVDGDGKPDVAVVNFTDNTVSVYLNTSTAGTISFAAPKTMTTSTGPYALAIGDVDGDGKVELVVANASANTISVFQNMSAPGNVLFAAKFDYATGNTPHGIAISDVNNDGKPEIITANFTGNSCSILQNASIPGIINAASFNSHTDLITGGGAQSVVVADINQDGEPDIIVANSKVNTISVLSNTTSYNYVSFSAKVDLITGVSPKSVAVGDMDGDGIPDLITANTTDNTVSVFRNLMPLGGAPVVTFAAKVDIATGAAPTAICVGDIDGDGLADLITANSTSNTYSVLRNDPTPASAVNVPPPTVTSFAPANGAAGTAITISGNNFNTTAASNIVFFGASQAVVNTASATQLTVTVPTGATYQPLSVLNTANHLTGYANTPFNTTFASKRSISLTDFSTKVDFTTATTPNTVTVGDIDGDGKPDVVIANSGSNTISIYRNTAASGSITASSFAPKIDLTTTGTPQSVIITDIDGDGKPDIIVTNSSPTNNGTISIFRNIAVSGSITTGSFAAKVDIAIGTSLSHTVVGDMDGDGKPDIVVQNGSVLSILLNKTVTGGITTTSFGPRADFIFSSEMTLADMNSDGKLDIVTSNIGIAINTSTVGNLSFAPLITLPNAYSGSVVCVADVDGDGRPDIITNGSNGITLSHNISTGNIITSASFDAPVSFAINLTVPYSPNGTSSSLVVADIDGDGKPDLLYANSGLSQVPVFRNISTNTTFAYSFFDTEVDFTAGTGNSGLAVADIDGDGMPDIIVVNQTSNTFSVLRNNPVTPAPSVPPVVSSVTPSSGPVGTTVTITGTNFNSSVASNVVYFGGVKATITSATTTKLVVTVPVGATYEVPSVLNKANGLTGYAPLKFVVTFPSKNDITPQDFDQLVGVSNYTALNVKVADIDGDGKPDLIFHNGYNSVSVIRNVSTTGSITPNSFGGSGNPTTLNFTVGIDPESIKVADIDGDGRPDLLVSYYSFYGIGVSVLLNTSTPGNISFAPKVDIAYNSVPYGNNTYLVNVGDVDGDGKPDILMANSSLKGVSVLPNTSTPGNVSFVSRYDFEAGRGSTSVNLADVDGDGKPDLVVTNGQDNTVSILRNITPVGVINSASFAKHVDYPTINAPTNAAIGDLNGDGKPDIVVCSSAAPLAILQNTSVTGTINSSSMAAQVNVGSTYSAGNMVEIADIDGDGFPDIVTPNFIVRNLTGSGNITKTSFSAANIVWSPTQSSSSICVGDVDGDGKPDLITTISSFSATIAVFRNDPSTVGPPKITSFSPASAAKGTTVTLTGVNFARIFSITFGGTAATSFNIVSPTTVTAVVGAGTTGKVAISTNMGKDTIAGFTYIPAPVLSYPGSWTITVNVPITPIVPVNNGGAITGTYTITPALPPGLTLDANTGIISGTPTAAAALTTYTITASNGSGISPATFSFAVQAVASISRPVISSFSPASGPVGTTVIINGSNFNPAVAGNVVFFGATRATVISASATQLKVAVPLGATFVPFSVLDNTTGLVGNSSKPFSITFSSKPLSPKNFDPRVDITSSAAPNSIYLFDIDGDGKPDMLTANSTDDAISIFRNISTAGTVTPGSFGPKVDIGTTAYAGGIVIGDIDGDGKPDLFVNNAFYHNISTPGSITSTSFAPPVTLAIPGTPALADVDGDGKLDLLCYNPTANVFSVFRNIYVAGTSITSASFASKVDFAAPGIGPLTMADLDNDGKPDVVSVGNGGNILVFRNLSTPGSITLNSFASPVMFPINNNCSAVKVADIDGDGKLDIIVSNYLTTSNISILRNTSTTGTIDASSFAPKVDFSTAINPVAISITDMDSDGKPDIVVGGGGNVTSVFRNLAVPGSFTTASLAPRFDLPAYSQGLDIGDVDGDGIPDIVCSISPVSIFRNNANENTVASVSQTSPSTGPPGTTITITGTNLIGVTAVSIGGVSLPLFNVNNTNTIITGNVPAGASGPVTVTTLVGTVTYGNFTILNAPNISYASPQSVFAGTAISPLSPANTGGAVPSASYWVTSTFAGNGTAASADGTGLSASFNNPYGIVADTAGNLYVADIGGNKVRKISQTGVVTTIAGTGTKGAVNGPGNSASFSSPSGMAIDRAGNLFVADYGNNTIRKIDPSGVVTTIAGTAVTGSTNGTGTAASFYSPLGVAVDTLNNLYVADSHNNLIRKIDPSGVVSTYAGAGTYSYSGMLINGSSANAVFNGPTGVGVDNSGNVLVADYSNYVVRKISPAGLVTTFAGSGFSGASDGYLSVASFKGPRALFTDKAGNTFVVDNASNTIRKIDTTRVVTTVAGTAPINNYPPSGPPQNGIGGAASFYYPNGIAGDANGSLYVTDGGNNLIRKIIYTGYTISPALPAGLTFDKNTGVISGTPTVVIPPTTYTIIATNEAGYSKTKLLINIIPPYPVITTSKGTTTFVSTSNITPKPILIDSLITVTHATKTTLPSGTVAITGNFNTNEDLLGFINNPGTMGNITSTYNAATGVLTLTSAGSAATIAQWQAALQSVTYINTKNNPTAQVKTISFTATDGTLTSPTVTKLVEVKYNTALNALTVSAGALSPVFLSGNVAYTDSVSNSTTTLSVTAAAADPLSTITINGVPVNNGITSGGINLNIGTDTISILVTGRDGVSKKLYSIAVTRAKATQTLTLATVNSVIYGAADFSAGATSNNLTIPITYASNNTNVATITPSGLIHIIGAGTVTITASQAGNTTYLAANTVTQTLTVTPASLNISTSNQSKTYGTANPVFTVSYTGFVNGDSAGNLISLPITSSTATSSSGAGTYPININGATSTNYVITYTTATLTITPAVLTIAADNLSKYFGLANPVLTATYSGFVNGDNATNLITLPTLSTTATTNSIAGNYPITVSGAVSVNYTFVYNNGTLTIIPGPVITSISPATAIVGTTVTITGTNFTGATSVSFGGVPAASFTVLSATNITAVVGNGSSGSVAVTTPAGTTNISGFNFVPVPTVSTSGSTTFITGGSVTLTGSPGTGYNYQWVKDGVNINGANTSNYTVTQSGSYNLIISLNNVSQYSAPVIVTSVFSLPATNFTIAANSATCRGSANGTITITAAQNLNYTATITGGSVNATYPFTTGTTISNLAAGTYNVCFTVAGQSGYSQCFTVVITEPKDLSVYTAVNNTVQSLNLTLDGGNIYYVTLNGVTTTTRASNITLALNKGINELSVVTDKPCQGTVTKQISIGTDVVAYPNPFTSLLNVNLGDDVLPTATLEVYSINGTKVYSKQFTNQGGIVQLDLSGLKPAMYVLKVVSPAGNKVYKILKQ